MAPDDGKPVGWFGLTEFQLLLAFFLVLLAAVTIVIIVVCVIRSCDIRCQRCPLNADNETSSEEGRGDSSSKSSIQIVVSDTRTVFAERIQSDERSGNLVAQIWFDGTPSDIIDIYAFGNHAWVIKAISIIFWQYTKFSCTNVRNLTVSNVQLVKLNYPSLTTNILTFSTSVFQASCKRRCVFCLR